MLANPLNNLTVLGAMVGWPFMALVVFALMPARRAVIVSFLGAWMFLPEVTYPIAGFPDYTKSMAATVGALLGVLVFDLKALKSLRLWWGDVPMIVYCLTPFASSMTNGLGAYDGVSAVFQECATWGIPYVLGRIYLRNMDDFRELARLLFIAGLVYVPLCVYEIRMSPQLNLYLYGFNDHTGGGEYAKELGAWGSRPRVFMGSGLALGTFMTAASVMGVWLWYTGAIKKVWGYAAGPFVFVLVLTAFMCKNMGALALLVFGLTALFSIRILNRGWIMYLLMLAAPLYICTRSTGDWSADSLVEMASSIHAKRGASLQGRLDNENILAAKALEQPVFGWGGWGRARVYVDGKDISVTDGLWIIVLGNMGIVGLTAVTSVQLLPPVLFAWKHHVRLWTDPRVAPAAAAAVLLVLYLIDNLFNAMFNPVYVLCAGGLISVVMPVRRQFTKPVPVPCYPRLRPEVQR